MQKIGYIIVVASICLYCGPKESSLPVLAKVGDSIITAETFQLNYEFGHGHLRQGKNSRRTVLDYMIYEKIMAEEARTMSLDTSQTIIHSLKTLKEELLIEQVFREAVLDKIEVNDDEIRAEINKAAVKFKFRFLPARDGDEAQELRNKIIADGWEETLDDLKEQFSEIKTYESELSSPFVAADEIAPMVLEVIKDLALKTPSEPVFVDGQWYIFEVEDISRQRLADEDYASKTDTYQKVLYNRKAMEGGTKFVADLMEPLQVKTKRKGFEILHEALSRWYQIQTPTRNLLYYIEEKKLKTTFTELLSANADETLVQFGNETWTIWDFLGHFTPGRYSGLRSGDSVAFKARLGDVVALVVRDAQLLEMAQSEELTKNAGVKHNIQLWKEKWMYQALRDFLTDSTTVSEADVASYYEKKGSEMGEQLYPFKRLSEVDKARIRRKMLDNRPKEFIDAKMKQYDISINETMLDTLNLTVSKQNPLQTVHLFKNNANKMPFPILDPNWKSDS